MGKFKQLIIRLLAGTSDKSVDSADSLRSVKALRTLSGYKALLAYITVMAIIALPLFGHLDEPPVQVWDEMRNGQNALEMNHTGRLIVTTYDYVPETWNTKPPLLIWILALSFHLLGNNELALRLPSALAAALTCLLVLRFSKRRTGHWMPGIMATIILVTVPGYVTVHGTRTGDYDALLVLCMTASLFWLCDYLEEARTRWLYLSAAALTAAVLTKGVAGLFACPAMLAYALLRGKAGLIFRHKAFYLCMLGFVIITGGYYALREAQQPGYLQAVFINELGGRYGQVIAGIDDSDFWTYCNELAGITFAPWMLLLVPAVCAGFAVRWRRWRRVALLCGLLVVTVLLILSCAGTKLWWYMMPVYPALALLCGMFVAQAMLVLSRWRAPARVWRYNFLPLLAMLAISVGPYKAILETTIGDSFPKRYPEIHDVGVYLKEVIRGGRPLGGNVLCGINPLPFRWYQEVVRGQGMKLDVSDADSLATGARVMAWDAATKDHIRQRYRQKETEVFRSLTIFLIEGKAGDTSVHTRRMPARPGA